MPHPKEYEQRIGTQLPDEYKDWLRLTKGLKVSFGCIFVTIQMPDCTEQFEDGEEMLCIGHDGGCRNYYINLNTGMSALYDDDFGTEEYGSFAELLDDVYCSDIESLIDEQEGGENWESVYDEMFPEEE